MYKHCNTEESAARQTQLVNCLLELMLITPYSQISVVDICQKAKISRKSFYRYFGSKEDCLNAMLDRAIMEGISRYFPDGQQPMYSTALYEQFFLYWREQASLLDALERSELSRLLVPRIVNYLYRVDRELRPYLFRHPDYALEHILFIISGTMELIFHWHRNGFRTPVAKMAEALNTILT